MAKQYIRTNASNIRDGTQGIELEFICVDNKYGKAVSGPIISSPVCTSTASPLEASASKRIVRNDYETEKFIGFNPREVDSANLNHQTLLESVNKNVNIRPMNIKNIKQSLKTLKTSNDSEIHKSPQYITNRSAENNKSKYIRKRKLRDNICESSTSSSTLNNEMILSNVFLSKSSREYAAKEEKCGHSGN